MRASVMRGADAQYIVDAINSAYNDGAESVREELRNLIGVSCHD